LRRSGPVLELRRSTADLTSRTADYLYWLGRHAERAEAIVRHLRSCVVRLSSDLEPAGIAGLFELVKALSDGELDQPPTSQSNSAKVVEHLRQEVIAWLFDASRAGSLAWTLESLRNAATQVRDRLSVDSWRIVYQMNLVALFPWEPQSGRLGDFVLLFD